MSKKISQLPSASVVLSTDIIPIVSGGVTYSAAPSIVWNFSNINGPIGSTTPAAGAFTTVTASTSLVASGSKTLTITGGSTPTIANSDGSGGITAFNGGISLVNQLQTSGVGSFINASGATTNTRYIAIANTTGNASFGLEGSAGGVLMSGSTAYATCIAEYAGVGIEFGVSNAKVASITSSTLTMAGKFVGKAGTGTGAPVMIGTLSVNTTAVGNVGGGTDDLMTYSLPANSLSANGKGVRVTAWGTVANNAAAKAATFDFGATSLSLNLRSNQDGTWRVEVIVIRTGSGAQLLTARFQGGPNAAAVTDHFTFAATPAETDTGAITIKCTGSATSDNDIVQKGMIVEFIS